mmetsp:Transcript_5872/g.8059  ORF Transcript_5872/g.8059 Transcript_5872/m.8059 type:complete len:317 (+) Transcript_5872:69-1019(+)|eukprot:CAMPEP_0117739066 /NCGR_PEP_ID=MMETSP0947-20121206/3518_1 /TAXON_ID=44440 /ORGANISM="Chattonella subsalsa, Strain CCMP2191" /LENGTH=316 /DNA_ID=CAMNT_0005554905 /DNA_START=50 /DNA_END=1000 /DNA_ORIENTATION=-
MEEEKENEIYDRQIRLWGLEAQKRMRSAKIFVVGMNTLNSELCKNLVLAGIGVTVHDLELICPQDVGCQFFFEEAHLGQNRAVVAAAALRELNPLVEVEVESAPLEDLTEDFFTRFQGVCLSSTAVAKTSQFRINQICRKQGSAFYSSCSFGFNGWIFCDLNHHEYQRDGGQGKPGEVFELDFPSMEDALATPWSSLKDRFGYPPKALIQGLVLLDFQEQYRRNPLPEDQDYLSLKSLMETLLKSNGMNKDFITEEELRHLQEVAGVELTPICAILGGIWGQEMIKAISAKGEPLRNMFVLSGLSGEGKVIQMPRA